VIPTLINSQPHRLAIEQQGSLPPQQLRSIASSIPVPSSKTTPAAPAAPNPSSLEYTTNTQRIRHSTAANQPPVQPLH